MAGETENDSSDEALCEMLGIQSLDLITDETPDEGGSLWGNSATSESSKLDVAPLMASVLERAAKNAAVQAKLRGLSTSYQDEGVCVIPEELSVPDWVMRRMTDELVWSGGDKVYASDKTYETVPAIQQQGSHQVVEKRALTRMENFVNHHSGWKSLCDYVGDILSRWVCLEPMVLFKEKLNLKPPGGSGFAPHLDTPSLQIALGDAGPQHFVTVMVAIDRMTAQNGCLRVCKGAWSRHHCVETIQPEANGNPDAGGRAGAIPLHVADGLKFENVECAVGGAIVAFGGWTPHRSALNASPFSRRAVFLTYNPAREGDHHDAYYQHMEQLRNDWRASVGLGTVPMMASSQPQLSEDEQAERDAIATIPRI